MGVGVGWGPSCCYPRSVLVMLEEDCRSYHFRVQRAKLSETAFKGVRIEGEGPLGEGSYLSATD